MQFIRSCRHTLVRALSVIIGYLFFTSGFANAVSHDNAVILLYHHVSNETPASTSLSPKTFEQHMQYLSENYTVLPLPKVVNALKNKQSLPDKTVAITFDDGYESIYRNAAPILSRLDLPYTIFINPGEIGHLNNQLTWEQVKELHGQGVDFANHTQDHLHMLNRQAKESEQEWLARVWKNVENAEDEIEQHIGESLQYLAYPFGEFNAALAKKVKSEGYVGFGQHSGGISSYSDFSALPRFPAAGNYANLESLKTKIASLGMPVVKTSIDDPERSQRKLENPVSFTVEGDDADLNRAACYFQSDTLAHKTDGHTLRFTLNKPLPVGRSRVNCTAPSMTQGGRFYWYSFPFFIAREDGTYPN